MTSPERIPLTSLLETGPCAVSLLKNIAAAIDKGAIFVYPTETIYGIGGGYGSPDVEAAIFRAKKRISSAPLILIASDRSFFNALSLTFPPAAETLARVFWPGMLTLVLPSPFKPEGIAVRVSSHPFITALFEHCITPLYSTSANMSGEAYVNDPDIIYSQFSGVIDFMIDAGPLPASPPSTVVRVGADNALEVVREGVIPVEKITALKK
jgi:L-threonylcarbamoyladenylate synthase